MVWLINGASHFIEYDNLHIIIGLVELMINLYKLPIISTLIGLDHHLQFMYYLLGKLLGVRRWVKIIGSHWSLDGGWFTKKMPNEPFKILRLRRVPSWNTTWLIAGIHGNPRDNHPDYPWSRIGSIPPKCSSSISMPLADLSENRKRHSSRFIRSWLVQTQIPLIMSLIIWNIGILDSTTPKKNINQGWPPAGPNITGETSCCS
jgi:hypothetical protein